MERETARFKSSAETWPKQRQRRNYSKTIFAAAIEGTIPSLAPDEPIKNSQRHSRVSPSEKPLVDFTWCHFDHHRRKKRPRKPMISRSPILPNVSFLFSLSLFSRISSLVESAATPSRLPLNERKTLLTNESILFHLGRDYWNTMNERGRGASRESKERARREGRRESERRRGGVERRE